MLHKENKKMDSHMLTNSEVAIELTIVIQEIKLALLKAKVCFSDISHYVLECEQFVGRLNHNRYITDQGKEVYIEMLIGLDKAEIELSIIDYVNAGVVFDLACFLENIHVNILTYLNTS